MNLAALISANMDIRRPACELYNSPPVEDKEKPPDISELPLVMGPAAAKIWFWNRKTAVMRIQQDRIQSFIINLKKICEKR
jgi:hypothetical protein